MILLATDLDRTLLPNGKQKHDGSMSLFRKMAAEKRFTLAYVTGRSLQLMKKGLAEYKAPSPKYAICDVGTRVYNNIGNNFKEDAGWQREIKRTTPRWDAQKFRKLLRKVRQLKIQERATQNKFKLSYYLYDLRKARRVIKEAEKIVKSVCRKASLVYSVDETTRTGLLDILPRHATKVGALEYLRKKLKLKKSSVVYCGDSGNDILPLTNGYKAILVRNSIPSVKKAVAKELKKKKMQHLLYTAKGKGKLNGYYVSGIIEGLDRMGYNSSQDLKLFYQ